MNTRPFAYTPGVSVTGTNKIGDISYGHPTSGFEGSEWWNGPDEDLGYVIAESVSDDSQPTPISGVTASVGFYRSEFKTEASFVELTNNMFDQTFTNGTGAKTWLNERGYWTSFGEDSITFVTGIQTFSVICRLPANTSEWGLINLDYTNNTSTVRALGLSRNDWSRQDFYPLNESGYMLVFSSNESGDHKILFLDAAGSTIQTVDLSGEFGYDVYDGKIMAVKYNGGIWYFDGLNVYQYTYDATDLNYAEIMWAEDAASSNSTFMFKVVYSNGDVVIKKLHNGTAATIVEYSISNEDYDIKLYSQADYYVIIKKLANGVCQDFKIRKISDDTQLHSVDLTVFDKIDETSMDYIHADFRNYSINKFAMVLHNYNDLDVDYRIYTYNGTTDVLNSTSHVKGTNYPNFNIITNQSTTLNTTGTDSVLMSFSSNSSWNGTMNTYAYFDIVYQMSWQTSLTTYVFTNAGVGNETGIDFSYDGFTNNYYTICTTNNTDLQVLSITEADGLKLITLGLLTDFDSPNIHSFGNKSCLRAYFGLDSVLGNPAGVGMILKYFGNTGGVIDELTVMGTTQYNINTYIGWNIFGIKHDGVLYQINTTTDEIVTIGPWYGNDSYTSNDYYEATSSARQEDLVHILFDTTTHDIRILKPTSCISGTLPDQNDFNFRVGKNRFMYIFENPNDGVIQINLYDFNLTLINSIVTDKTNFNFNTRGVKDRFIARHNDGSDTYTWFMITDTFDDAIMTSTSDTTRIENDWIYWN